MLFSLPTNIPGILYKHHNLDKPNYDRIIFQQMLQFWSLEWVEDMLAVGNEPPKVHKKRKRKTLPTPDLVYGKDSLQMNKNVSELSEEFEFFPSADRDHELDNLEMVDEQLESYGIISLFARPDEGVMASGFPGGDKGVAIGFNTELLQLDTQCELCQVDYSHDRYQKYYKDSQLAVHKRLCTSIRFFEYEQEFKLIKRDFVFKELKLSPRTLEDVTFGLDMEVTQKQSILTYMQKHLPHVTVHEIRRDGEQGTRRVLLQ